MEVYFHIMIDKLNTGVWKKATTKSWKEGYGQYITLKKEDSKMILLVHETSSKTITWTLNMRDSLNMKFIELKD